MRPYSWGPSTIFGLFGASVNFNVFFHGLIAVPLAILTVAVPFNAYTPSETDLSKSALLSAPPAPLSEPVTLKIATFNIHDLLVVAFDHKARMRAIGEVLTELDPDIVGIQEAFIEADRAVLFEAIEGSRLQYRQYFPSGIAGSGLLTLSAYPIREAFFHRYVQGGKWYKPYHGDWWGGKGVSLARIELPGGACVDFFDTHAQASYWTRNEYLGIRKAQMRELAAFVGASATGAGPAFLVGDMNCRPGAPDFQIAVEQGKLKRVMAVETPIDHIFRVENPRYRFETLDTRPIEGTVDLGGRQSRLSDHTGYMSTVRVTPQ